MHVTEYKPTNHSLHSCENTWRDAWRFGYRSHSLSHTHTHLNEFHLLPTHLLFLSRSCVYRNNVHAPIISRRGRQSVRGIFRLTDFHLQSGNVTFVWGNEIALQQTVGYIIPSRAHTLLFSFFFFSSFISGFFSHCSSAPETQKKPVSQDQLVTSREL